MMSLYRYFKPSVSLPSPNGPLADSMSSATIKKANQAIVEATSKSHDQKSRGTYCHVDAEMQVKMVQYAREHGNKAAMEHFTYQLGFDVKKDQYLRGK